jgi:hypothetical protein
LGQHPLQNGADADGEQGLLGVPQQVDDPALGVAQEDAFAVGEQVQAGAARKQFGQAMAEFAAQQVDHFADALQAEAAPAQVAQDGQLG